jgi:hypothetical protein
MKPHGRRAVPPYSRRRWRRLRGFATIARKSFSRGL